jgi:hypothetical protein
MSMHKKTRHKSGLYSLLRRARLVMIHSFNLRKIHVNKLRTNTGFDADFKNHPNLWRVVLVLIEIRLWWSELPGLQTVIKAATGHCHRFTQTDHFCESALFNRSFPEISHTDGPVFNALNQGLQHGLHNPFHNFGAFHLLRDRR